MTRKRPGPAVRDRGPGMYGIYREPGPAARRRRKRYVGDWAGAPQPKRCAVIEAASEEEALWAFHRAEQVRSSHVGAAHMTRGGYLVVTIENGRSSHEARYMAWRQER